MSVATRQLGMRYILHITALVALLWGHDCKRVCTKDSQCTNDSTCVKHWRNSACITNTAICPTFDLVQRDSKAKVVSCSHNLQCDTGYMCTQNPMYNWMFVCCPQQVATSTRGPLQTCANGAAPYRNADGKTVNCGFGLDHEECPFNYFCRRDTRFTTAVCCSLAKPGTCPSDVTRDGTSCSDDAECPKEQKCCKTGGGEVLNCVDPVFENKTVQQVATSTGPLQTCTNGAAAYRNADGDTVNCGFGLDHEECPFNYFCRRDIRFATAVCCSLAKPGTCPSDVTSDGTSCSDDAECPKEQKCCRTGGGEVLNCVDPVFENKTVQ